MKGLSIKNVLPLNYNLLILVKRLMRFELMPFSAFKCQYKHTMNFDKILKYICFFLAIATIIFCVQKCTGESVTITEPDKIDTIAIKLANENVILTYQVNQYKKQSDSLKGLKPPIKTRYITVYDSVYMAAPDTCHRYLELIQSEHAKLDILNDLIIAGQDSVIFKQSLVIANRNDLIRHQDSVINSNYNELSQLKKSLLKSNKRAKRNFWIGLGTGAAIGAFGTMAVLK